MLAAPVRRGTQNLPPIDIKNYFQINMKLVFRISEDGSEKDIDISFPKYVLGGGGGVGKQFSKHPLRQFNTRRSFLLLI